MCAGIVQISWIFYKSRESPYNMDIIRSPFNSPPKMVKHCYGIFNW